MKEIFEQSKTDTDDMRPEYDFTKMEAKIKTLSLITDL